MSLLTIVQAAAVRSNITSPSSAFSSVDPLIQQMVAFAQDGCQDLYERWDWRRLKISATITGDGSTTLWPQPADFGRLDPSDKSPSSPFVSNLYPLLPLVGPINDEILTQYKVFPAFPVRPFWRLVGTSIEIWPPLASVEVVTYTYFSKNYILDSGGVAKKAAWGGDNDTSLIPEDLVMKYSVWRWKATKGLDYGEDMRIYEKSFSSIAGQEGQERSVITSRTPVDYGDTFWPGTISYTPP